MQIKLVTNTPQPKRAIAAAFLNMGIGRDIADLEKDMTEEEANDAMKEIFSSHLDAPLEFASFNFIWEDIPLFLRAQLVRHRVGWGFAERSLRFFDANLKNPADNYDWDAMPSIKGKTFTHKFDSAGDKPMEQLMEEEMKRQMIVYSEMIKQGVDQQEARNVIGVWFPTTMQTTCTYRALRNTMADRLSSQAHPFWQKAAKEIKRLVTEIDPVLGDGLIDSCQLAGRCVWNSRFDRDCDACIARGTKVAHEHKWTRETSFGPNTQCDCGIMNQKLLKGGN